MFACRALFSLPFVGNSGRREQISSSPPLSLYLLSCFFSGRWRLWPLPLFSAGNAIFVVGPIHLLYSLSLVLSFAASAEGLPDITIDVEKLQNEQ